MLTISMLAREAGVGVETVRFYQRKGLLRSPERPPGGSVGCPLIEALREDD